MIIGRITEPRPAGTMSHPLYREGIQLVGRSHHPLSERHHLSLEDVIDFPWILPGDDTDLRAELERFFAHHGFGLPDNRVETTSYLTVRQLLLSADFLAALPQFAAKEEGMTLLPLHFDTIGDSVGVTTASDRTLGPAARAMLSSFRAIARELTALHDSSDEGPTDEA